MDPSLEALIHEMHATPTKAVLYVTGGAVQALSWLLMVPGASGTVIEASVPYARESLVAALQGQEPPQYCSEDTAVQMATAAYRRAAALSPGFGTPLIGVGATCALASVPLKRGDHRAFLACHGAGGTKTLSVTLAKGERSRMGEDTLVSTALVKLMAQAMDLDPSSVELPFITHPSAEDGKVDVVQEGDHPLGDPIQALLEGRVRCVEFGPGGQVLVDAPRTQRVVLPGSFNPLHEGHRQLLAAATEQHNLRPGAQHMDGCFELSVGNADKGLLPEEEVRRRAQQFIAAGLPLVLSSAPLFTMKAELMRGCRFVLGHDTAVRIVMPKYYGDSRTAMLLEFERLRALGCSFLVAGRRDDASGRFLGLESVDVPPELRELFEGVSESSFRVDLSSTELRRKLQQMVEGQQEEQQQQLVQAQGQGQGQQ